MPAPASVAADGRLEERRIAAAGRARPAAPLDASNGLANGRAHQWPQRWQARAHNADAALNVGPYRCRPASPCTIIIISDPLAIVFPKY